MTRETTTTMMDRVNRLLSMSYFRRQNRFCCSSNRVVERKTKSWLGIVAGMLGGCSAVLYALNESTVNAEGLEIKLPKYPWSFNGFFKSFDHAALRRGWTVYRNVCRTCHSLQYVRFIDMINVTHTLEEVKAIAEEFEVQDGPNEEGEYYMRPAKLSDKIPSPFPNEEAARAANFGAYPPDLTYIVYTRYSGIDFVFSLLTGFMDPPAGIQLQEGQYFNIYFPGGFTSMAQVRDFLCAQFIDCGFLCKFIYL